MNPMQRVEIEKVTLNIGCGGDLEKIEKAKKLLEILTKQKPLTTLSRKRSTFGIARGKPIGVKVTLRKKKAEDFLKLALTAKGNKLDSKQFDENGNFSFGIEEYIELPGVKYIPEIGILGMNVCVTLKKPGYRIKYRKVQKKKIPKKYRITKEEAIDWVRKKFGVEIDGV